MCLKIYIKKDRKCGFSYLAYVHRLTSMLSLDVCRVGCEPKHDMNSLQRFSRLGRTYGWIRVWRCLLGSLDGFRFPSRTLWRDGDRCFTRTCADSGGGAWFCSDGCTDRIVKPYFFQRVRARGEAIFSWTASWSLWRSYWLRRMEEGSYEDDWFVFFWVLMCITHFSRSEVKKWSGGVGTGGIGVSRSW